jgi:EmrB/QacA subfamily drug resistance transporter
MRLPAAPDLRTGTPAGRWVIAASVLGSGVAFLDGTVVNAALPAIGADFHVGLASLQWVITAYLLTLGSLLVLGGSLGDLFGRRRVFVIGLCGFGAASLLCGIAPSDDMLIAARAVQGAAAALLVPGSLAIISASFRREDRGRAIGAWSGLAGVATAVGPFIGGWLIDAVSWRAVFLINLPVIVVTIVITLRHVPETRDVTAARHIDGVGGALLALGLAGVVYGLIEGPGSAWSGTPVVALVAGAIALALFLVVEARSAHPMVPLGVFRSQQFSGANAVTFAVYAALGVTMFLLVVHLQTDLGYSALEAGASLLPLTVLMLLFSARAGALAQRIGPRLPMTIGPLIAAAGIALLSGVEPGVSYWSGVFPGVVVLSVGLVFTVAPLTATVLAAVEDAHAGIASAINNAVARIAGLIMIAVVPAVAGLSGTGGSLDLDSGFGDALMIAAATCAVGGVIAWLTIRRAVPVQITVRADLSVPCEPPCVLEPAGRA